MTKAASAPASSPTPIENKLRLGYETPPASDLDRQHVSYGAGVECRGICGGMRSSLWSAGWEVVKHHWITGIGYGGWRFALLPLLGYAYSSPHNATLHLWGMFGLPGLALSLGFIGIVVWRYVRLRRFPSTGEAAVTWASAGVLFMLMVVVHETGETSMVLSLSRFGLFAWILLAMQSPAFVVQSAGLPPIDGRESP